MVEKDWIGDHFGDKQKQPVVAQKPKRRRIWPLILIGLPLMMAGTIGVLHQQGIVNVGEWWNTITHKASDVADSSSEFAEGMFIPSESIDDFDQKKSDSDLAETAAAVQAPTLSESQRRSITNGIQMMSRDLTKVEKEIAARQNQLTIKYPNRRPPTAAEREKLASDYLHSGRRMTPDELFRVRDVLRNAQAEQKNHRIRIKELSSVRASLFGRLERAKEKLGEGTKL